MSRHPSFPPLPLRQHAQVSRISAETRHRHLSTPSDEAHTQSGQAKAFIPGSMDALASTTTQFPRVLHQSKLLLLPSTQLIHVRFAVMVMPLMQRAHINGKQDASAVHDQVV